MKCLVIGDTHFDNPYNGYLDSQLLTCFQLVDLHKPKYLIFLGDVFHHRKPNPEVLVKVSNLFRRLQTIPGLTRIIVLRGNHDSANKSDDGLTALSVLSYPGNKVEVILQTTYDEDLNLLLIPHYEQEEKIKDDVSKLGRESTVILGHFGYTGCLNSCGFFDFSIDKELLNRRTILGHIHRYTKDGDITILGTPWATNFGECDYQHYVATMDLSKDKTWSDLQLHEVRFGPRFYACPYESLEIMKDEICDVNYFTILRVFMSKFSDNSSNELRSKIISEYNVGFVDVKFQPMLDKKLSNRLSNYNPDVPLNSIDSSIIERYIEEQASNIPRESLEEGLDLIRQHEDIDS